MIRNDAWKKQEGNVPRSVLLFLLGRIEANVLCRSAPIRLFRLTVFQFRMLFQEFMLEVEGFPQSVFSRVGARYFLPVNFDPGVKDTVPNGTKLSG